MYIDKELRFSVDQAVTTGSDTGILSTNQIDLKKAGLNLGVGKEMYLVAQITETLDDTGDNSDLRVDLLTDDDPAIGSPVVLAQVGIFPALAPAGSRLILKLPVSNAYLRYMATRYQVNNGNGALSAGKVSVFLTPTLDAWKPYPAAVNIS